MAAEKLFTDPHVFWLNGTGTQADIVLSSRIRLARNFNDIPFPNRANLPQLAKVKELVGQVLPDIEAATGLHYQSIGIDELTKLEKNVLIEKHLISRNHINSPEERSVLISEDSRVSIMVNEEDHLRLQCMVSGLDLKTPLALAMSLDDVIESSLSIAFDEKMGYLTSCPTNLGTGLRASVMLHLPGLVFTQQIGKIINISPQLGLAVRGLYGEGTEFTGNIFQISNQLTLGFTEEGMIDNLTGTVHEIITHEKAARESLLNASRDKVVDSVWRAFGILRYARSVTEKEVLVLLSKMRLGVDLGVINEVNSQVFNELLVASQTNYLRNLQENENMSQSEIDKKRAEIIRTAILKFAIGA